MCPVWNLDRTKVFSRKEIAAVLADLRRKSNRFTNTRMNLIIFRLACCCGLRVSEIAGLELQDIRTRTDRPYINIRKEIAKGRKARRVPLWWDAGTLADLERWLEFRKTQDATSTSPYVCMQRQSDIGKPLDRFNIRKRFITSCGILGKDRRQETTIHHGRHSFISHSLAGGRSLAEVREAAGHENLATTSLYTHIVNDDDTIGNLFDFEQQ